MADIQINNENGQLVTCGHTQYGGYSVIQRLWLGSAFLHLDKEVASKPRIAHTANRCSQFMRTILLNIIILSGLLISCDFKSTDQYFNDACKKEEQGDYEGAIKDLDIVLKRKPNDIEVLINRAIDKKTLDRYENSMQDFNKAMTLDSNNIMALYNRGNLYAEIEQYEKAIEDYNKAIKLKGGENLYFEWKDNESFGLRFSDVEMEAIRLQRGLSHAELSDYENAFSDFSFCIEKKYGHDLAYLWRGVCFYYLGHPDKACEDWKKSNELGMEEAQDYLIKNCKVK